MISQETRFVVHHSAMALFASPTFDFRSVPAPALALRSECLSAALKKFLLDLVDDAALLASLKGGVAARWALRDRPPQDDGAWFSKSTCAKT